jgi:ABC-type Fe3+/spermidine/putrescine transport system ATPase subunit
MVKLENICKSFGSKTVIQDFSLEIEEGERFVLLGGSGCGKTTLLRLIAGLEVPGAGKILIDGEEVGGLAVEKRPVGFIFQRHALFPHMTVYDNIAVGPRVRGLDENEIRKKIDGLLEVTRLKDLRDNFPDQISGGESQRVAIARAVINRPKVLLLDEPLSSLDVNLRRSLREELVEMQKTFGITFLFVTHDREEAMSLADRMGIMKNGNLLQPGSPEDLYDRPENLFTAKFLGDINQLHGKISNQEGNQISVTIDDICALTAYSEKSFKPNANVVCLIRPERIFISQETKLDEKYNRLEGKIERRVFYGNTTQCKVRLTNGQIINLALRRSRSEKRNELLEAEKQVQIVFEKTDVILFQEEADE